MNSPDLTHFIFHKKTVVIGHLSRVTCVSPVFMSVAASAMSPFHPSTILAPATAYIIGA
jgi:hypothetical protein